MKITIFALGSRGDVQPFLALALGLQQTGHQVTLVVPRNFAEWIRSYGVGAYPVRFNVQEFMQKPETLAVLKSGNPVRLFRMVREYMGANMREALDDFWQAAQDADFVVQTLGGHGGIEVASQRDLPMAFAFLQPFAHTRSFPSFFLGPVRLSLGGSYNYLTHMLMDRVLWLMYGEPTNKWRASRLGLSPWRSYSEMHNARRGFGTPWLFAYSPSVMPKPSDWAEYLHITGYWFLDAPPNWQPSTDLARFLDSGPPPVYVGFGSMSDEAPERLTRLTLRALELTGQRGVLATGWGGVTQLTSSANVYYVDNAPHDWLFPRMAVVVHHGGAGTTAAGLRAGVPSIITPFTLDQYAWADLVAKLVVCKLSFATN
ncbi:MAG TPA: glycosyltransferase [Anaerolineales bacterium]|nr:glycosyltransferase [Anaerolineales bacterium]